MVARWWWHFPKAVHGIHAGWSLTGLQTGTREARTTSSLPLHAHKTPSHRWQDQRNHFTYEAWDFRAARDLYIQTISRIRKLAVKRDETCPKSQAKGKKNHKELWLLLLILLLLWQVSVAHLLILLRLPLLLKRKNLVWANHRLMPMVLLI